MHAHDPTPLAWFITIAYFGAAILTLVAARASEHGRNRIFWFGTSALLLLLGFNKQLDLQGYVTTAGRVLAHQEGWFGERRVVQETFILVICTVALAILLALAIWLRRSTAAVRSAAFGIVLLVAFVVIRAASFHHMDLLVTLDLHGMRSGWWLELAGITIIAVAAVAFLRGNRASPARF